MIKAANYHIHKKNGYLVIVNHDTPVCPKCGGGLSVRGSYPRSMKDASGSSHTFRLRQLYCSTCHRTHSEIPDCMKAFKHYSSEVIEKVLNGELDHFPGDASTSYRWQKNNTHTLQ